MVNTTKRKMSVKGRVDSVGAQESGNRASIGKITQRGLKRHYDEISAAAFVQMLIRAAVIAPLIFCESVGGRIPDILAGSASLAIYIFILIPMRFWARQKVRRVYYRHSDSNKKQTDTYNRWMATGLLRYLRGLLWGLPFIACVVYFTVLRTILDAPTFNAPIHWLAMLLAGNPSSGSGNVSLALIIIGAAIVLFALLFAYGWWRDLPVEYLPVRSIGGRQAFRWSRHIRKHHKKEMRKAAWGNILLSLPGILGFGVVLGLYAMQNVNFSMSVNLIITQVRRLFTQPIPNLVLLELLAVFAVLYLPLCVYRKARNAALMGRLIKRQDRSEEKQDAQEESETPAANAPVMEENGEARRQYMEERAKYEEKIQQYSEEKKNEQA